MSLFEASISNMRVKNENIMVNYITVGIGYDGSTNTFLLFEKWSRKWLHKLINKNKLVLVWNSAILSNTGKKTITLIIIDHSTYLRFSWDTEWNQCTCARQNKWGLNTAAARWGPECQPSTQWNIRYFPTHSELLLQHMLVFTYQNSII